MLPELGFESYRLPLGEGRTLVLIAASLIAALWLYVWPRRGKRERLGGKAALILLGLRLAAVAVVGWMLAGPVITQATETQQQRARVMLLLDTSLSMAEEDVRVGGERISRWDAIAERYLDPQYIAAVQEQAELEGFAFDREVRAIVPRLGRDLEPVGQATHLYAALREAALRGERGYWVAGDRPDGGIMLVISDGHDTSGEGPESAISMLAERGWRIFSVPVGRETEGPDVAVRAWADSPRLLEGQSTQLRASITGPGAEGRNVQVNLLHEGRRVDGTQVMLDEHGRGEARFTIRPEAEQAGEVKLHAYEVVAEPLPGERHTANNRAPVFVQVSRERMRVLVLDGRPSWDTRFAIRALRGDAQVELMAIHALGEQRVSITRYHPEQADAGPGDDGAATTRYEDSAALDADAFSRFDIIVLGRAVERLLDESALDRLGSFIEQDGGSLVLAAGRPFETDTDRGRAAMSRMAELLPVEWGTEAVSRLQLELTPPGRTEPVLDMAEFGDTDIVLSRLPAMRAATRVSQARAASIILAEQRPAGEQGPAMAAMAYQNVGADGRVFAILGDGMWQWSFLPPGLEEYRSLYEVFWSRLMRWLALGDEFLPGQDVSLSLDRTIARRGQDVEVEVATRIEADDFDPQLTITSPEGETTTLSLTPVGDSGRRFGGRIHAAQAGVYEVELSAALAQDQPPVKLNRRFAVREASEELRDPSADRAAMESLAEATGGRVLELDQRETLLEDLQDRERLAKGDPVVVDAFDQPWLLWLALLLLSTEWFARRRMGAA